MVLSCEGPAGPEGPQGQQGPQGEQGLQGPMGEEGTANVIYSDWLDIDWDQDGTNSKAMFITEPLITDELIENGTILMFIRSQLGNVVFPLPYINSGDYLYFAVGNEPGVLVGILFAADSMDGSSVGSYSENQIRYILIPGGVQNKVAKTIDFKNYNQVAKIFNIRD